jgi:hypothetical protein
MSLSLPNLFKIDSWKNQLVSTIIQKNIVAPNKFYFTDDCKIEIPRLIEVVNKDTTIKKTCTYSKNFTDSYLLSISNNNLDYSSKFLIPYFSSNKFKCLSCNKLHDGKTDKCCSMEKSVVLLEQAKLYKVEIPILSDIEKTLQESKEEFVRLHFVDFLDTIMLR